MIFTIKRKKEKEREIEEKRRGKLGRTGNNMAATPGNKGRGWHNTAERLRRKDITVIIQCLQQSTRFRPGRKLVIPTLRKLSALCANYKFVNWQVDPSTSRCPRHLFWGEARMTMMYITGVTLVYQIDLSRSISFQHSITFRDGENL